MNFYGHFLKGIYYVSSETLNSTHSLTHSLSRVTRKQLSDLGGPDRLVKWMKDFEAEAIFLGRTFKQLARRKQHGTNPVTRLVTSNNQTTVLTAV